MNLTSPCGQNISSLRSFSETIHKKISIQNLRLPLVSLLRGRLYTWLVQMSNLFFSTKSSAIPKKSWKTLWITYCCSWNETGFKCHMTLNIGLKHVQVCFMFEMLSLKCLASCHGTIPALVTCSKPETNLRKLHC